MRLGGVAFTFLPLISAIGRIAPTRLGKGERPTAALADFAQRIHPGYKLVTLGVRDVVAAQKMQYLMETQGFGHLLVSRGTEHIGIERAIKTGEEERLDFLKRIRPILPFALKEEPSTFYGISVCRKSPRGDWLSVEKMLEEPRLKEIFSGK